MPKALKTPAQKRAYEVRLEAIRPALPIQPAAELSAFCRYTGRPEFDANHVHNVTRQPIRRYDDGILSALEEMVASLKEAA